MYGSKISSIRLARGFTQEYMAQRLDMAQNAYCKIEKDTKVKVNDTLLGNIADTLGVSVDDIKSPMPIVMNFSGFTTNGNGHETMNAMLKLFDTFQQQIAIQNKILELLLNKIK